jgi:hypothetical protein
VVRRMPALTKAACVAHIGALICLAVAFDRRNSFEGAYFNRSVGAPANAGVFVGRSDMTPWLIAAAALLVIGTAAFVRAALADK